MRLPTFTVLMLLTMTARLQAEPEAVHSPPRSISTSGEAIVYVVPDEVIVNFGVQTFDRDLDKSKSANDEMSAKLLKSIKALGVEDKHVQTDTLNISIQYNDRHQGIEGYTASRLYSVTLKDTKLLEKLIDTGLKNGANQLHGFEFKTSELRKHRDQARKVAIKAAKEKAVALAGELEMKIGKPQTISEGSVGYYSSRSWGGNSFGNASQNAMQAAPEGGEGGETMPLGQMAVHASVSVTFDLE
jgi:uncharacterized protein YggE